MSSWSPLPMMLCGRVAKPFTPLDNHNLTDPKVRAHFRNAYPGDLVYLFESESKGKWARGYLVSQPNPSDFSTATVNLEHLPESKVSISILPFAHIKTIIQLEVSSTDDDYANNVILDYSYLPDLSDDASLNSSNLTTNQSHRKSRRPSLPVNNVALSSKGLSQELDLSMKALAVHLFALYTKGDLNHFKKLFDIFLELDDIRINFENNLLTKNERLEANRQCAFLLTKISKFAAAANLVVNSSNLAKETKDISGYECILARDEETGELYSHTNENLKDTLVSPAKIAQSQIFCALSPNYPMLNSDITVIPERNCQFDQTFPSHILVDFQAVSGTSTLVPKGYDGMTAYLYLRNAKKRLTEACAVTIKQGQHIPLENLSAALFGNVPTNEIDTGRIYLVALLTETINIEDPDAETSSTVPIRSPLRRSQTTATILSDSTNSTVTSSNHINSNGDDDKLNSVPDLKTIRRGICAGAVDISRIFSRHKGHLQSGQAHQFTMKMFSSYMTKDSQEIQLFAGMNSALAMSMAMPNNGWGELVDRIISGSSKGIAVNPRTEKLIVLVKEVKQNSLSTGAASFDAVDLVKTICFNPLDQSYSRIYLRLIKTSDIPCVKPKPYITVELSSSSSTLVFSKGTNEKPMPKWQFTSTAPEEYISELIQITGLTDIPTKENDHLYFDVYANAEYVGSGKYPLRYYNQIMETGLFSKKSKRIDIFNSGIPAGSVEIDIEYVGKNYNIDTYVALILNWKRMLEKNVKEGKANLFSTLKRLRKVGLQAIVKFFPELLTKLLEIYEFALETSYGSAGLRYSTTGTTAPENSFESLNQVAFEAIVQVLDITIARQNQYIYLFDDFMKSSTKLLPKVGETLVTDMNKYLASFEDGWGSTGRAICRSCVLILRIANVTVNDRIYYLSSAARFSDLVAKFLSSNNDQLVGDQVILIEILELVIEALRKGGFDDSQLITLVTAWTTSMGVKGLGAMEELSNNPLVNKKKKKKHSLIINKLYFVNRSLHSFLVDTDSPKARELLFSNAICAAFEVLMNRYIDIVPYRLALGILLSAMTVSFGKEKRFYDESNELYLVLSRMFAPLSIVFNKVMEFCRSNNMLKGSRRTFNQLFPPSFPFEEYTIDSTVVHDEPFSEILVEFTAVLVMSSQISAGIHELLTDIYTNNLPYSTSYKAINNFLGDPSSSINPSHINATTQTIRIMIDPIYYPFNRWISFKAITVQSYELYLENFVHRMIPLIPSSPDQVNLFPKKMFTNYLMTMLKCACSKTSSVEHLSNIPRKGCSSLTGDIRTRCAISMFNTWKQLGKEATQEEKGRFHLSHFGGFQELLYSNEDYSLLFPLLLFCLQRNEKCLELGSKMFWSIIVSEWCSTQSLYELETQVMGSLYDIFLRSPKYAPDIIEVKNFTSALKLCISLDIEDEAYQPIFHFVNTLSEFLTTAAELKTIPEGDEFDDDRTFHKLNISGYLMNVDKPELFQSFINSMYVSHLDKKNYIQAALCLELLANTYNWDTDTYLPPCAAPSFPSQTEFKRKESLYRLMASNFTKGDKIDQAVECYKELLDAYDNFNFDLAGLSYCYAELSKAFDELQSVGRIEPSYFKISFIGHAFPATIRGKEFIYEGLPFEHITSVNHRLTRLYPGSRIITSEDVAKKLLLDTPIGKYLHIKTVSPQKCTDTSHNLTFMTRQYIEKKNLNTFVSVRRIPGAKSVESLWTEEVTYETVLTFPTLMNRSEIKTTNVIRLSPIKNAVKALIDKNEELSSLEYSIKQDLKEGIDFKSISASSVFNNLSRTLAGTVDSPVNGGVGQYRIFLSKTSVEGEPDYETDVKLLKTSFNSLIILLDKLLKLHEALIPSHLKPQHEAMVELFGKNFQDEVEELKLDVHSQLNLNKLLSSLISTNVHSRHRNHNQQQRLFTPLSPGSEMYYHDDDSMSFSNLSGGSERTSSNGTSFMVSSNFSKKTVLNYK